ncbi:meiosis 1 arrest protein-like [Mercenaria mercenaria]|uniref:meiosis 1 arrest protein-like n=1 Tax=Mercenaria mercenaria TaxID=6596 RepID=UPI00234F845E|nr:meiosis 1 arrest protein-like [Mercenaria mercenaria]XP_053384830.1 meiosis 1 arrest protein-like [Mercenaria mercenaria]
MGENQRTLLGKQPVRILMLDFSPPFTVEVGEDVCDTLENLFSLACNLSGPSRIPFFSLMVLNNYPEVLLPFSYVRNNYQRIQIALSEVRSLIQDCTGNRPTPCYYQGLAEACSQYRRQLQSSFQGGTFHQLEILVVTCQRPHTVQKQVETALTTLDTENLKRIQLLCISNVGVLSLDDIGNSQSSASSENSSNNSVTNTGLVEVINLEPDVLCLQNIFSGWLVDSGTDSEHLHLILPPVLDSNVPLVVKCDLHERVLQPAQLPFYNQFTLHCDSSAMKMVFPSTSKAMGMSVPIYKLQITGLVPLTTICDSLVFGMPMIAQPTSCWKIDWDDLEKNQQLFKSFCHTLSIKEQAAIAHSLPSDNITKSRTGHHPSLQPSGHFVLVPSSNCTLLVKSIAVQELMLPYSAGNQEEEVDQEFVDIVAESLDQLEITDTYNPLNYSSNLYESLKNIGKKPVSQRQQKRPLDENTTVYTNKMVTTKSNKQPKRTSVVEISPQHDIEPADTPLGKRLLNKTAGKTPRRMLYTASHNKFLPEDASAPEQSANVQTFRSGGTMKTKTPVSFPTSL